MKRKKKNIHKIWIIPISHVTHTCFITVQRFFVSAVVHCYFDPTALYEECSFIKKKQKKTQLLLAAGCVLVSM